MEPTDDAGASPGNGTGGRRAPSDVATDGGPAGPAVGRWRVLGLVTVAEAMAVSLWFSATAAAPELADAWGLTGGETALLTSVVQVGFVVGALVSATLTLSDVVETRYLFAASAVVGAAFTAAIALAVDSFVPAVALRFLTGVALAGVYPPGMKMVAGWFRSGRGLAIGTVIGGLTLGSASPHLLRAAGGVGRPRVVLLGAAGLAVAGGVLALRVRPGPYAAPAAPFDPSTVGRIVRNRGASLANLGYFGHMWELYAVWTWLPVFFAASPGLTDAGAALLTFGTIAAGGVGAVVAGRVADRVGRTTVTSASMVASGTACLAAGLVFGAPLVVLVPFVLAWGAVVVADSAQFSTAISELTEGEYVGTALTLQTAVGFLVTTVSIQLVPVVADVVGWRWAFAVLAVGPVLGTAAMLRLRGLPEAARLAGGRG